jgi:hypothetical protein
MRAAPGRQVRYLRGWHLQSIHPVGPGQPTKEPPDGQTSLRRRSIRTRPHRPPTNGKPGMSTLHPHVECLALLGWRLYPASRHIGPPALEIQARRQPTMLTGCRPGQPNFQIAIGEWFGGWMLMCHPRTTLRTGLPRWPIPPRPMTRSGGGGLAPFFRYRGESTGQPAGPFRESTRGAADSR